MASNPLTELSKLGQSFWFDNISRGLINSGQLKRMIDEDDLRGITSNPSIFYNSIKAGSDYDGLMQEQFSDPSRTAKEVFYALEQKDITEAADLLKGVYDKTEGRDGFVSIEVDPNFAYDTDATIKEARALFKAIGRPNVMIKVPATPEGLPAIRQLTAEGYSVNATLLFSITRYEEVVNAYLDGLSDRLLNKESIASVASVASFFVSRLDTVVDAMLKDRTDITEVDDFLGKTAVANAKTAYQAMVTLFSSERFLKLKERGGKVQRLLWASTSTKNPAYNNCLYVNNLIGPHTVNTMPDETVKAFKSSGIPKRTIDQDLEDTEILLNTLDNLNIDINAITLKLEQDGVRLFIESFNNLLLLIQDKRG
ncbi:MAG: transaldolase [Nitrospirae bacterium]|nr:transaldolase [Nitrospirota bacterium]